MRKFWHKISETYKIFISMLLFIMLIQLGTIFYIWSFESKVLLNKATQNLSYQLDTEAKLLEKHLYGLKKELKFLSTLEVMDDILVKDVDKRIAILLEKKSKDLGDGVVLVAKQDKLVVSSSKQNHDSDNYLEFSTPLHASFKKEKRIGSLHLLYPLKSLRSLKSDNPHQRLWIDKINSSKRRKIDKTSIVVSKNLRGVLSKWQLSLSYEKESALEGLKEIEKILLGAFLVSLLALLFVVWRLSKKQIKILEHTEGVLALKRTFLSTMSHELRTPLGSILSLTQHLMVSPKVGDDEVEILGRIENSSEHLLGMINGLLQLSKLESNMMTVTKEKIYPLNIIEEMIEIVEPLIEEKGLKLVRDISTQDVQLYTDVNLFKQVVMNLLSNAVKYTDRGEIVTYLRRDEDGSYVFTVTDTGIGIAKDKQNALFQEFYQAHSREVSHSTGLGLALSQKMANLINGKIVIESDGLNQGVKAEFIFSSL
jgi:signal transduction histidine kinase